MVFDAFLFVWLRSFREWLLSLGSGWGVLLINHSCTLKGVSNRSLWGAK